MKINFIRTSFVNGLLVLTLLVVLLGSVQALPVGSPKRPQAADPAETSKRQRVDDPDARLAHFRQEYRELYNIEPTTSWAPEVLTIYPARVSNNVELLSERLTLPHPEIPGK